MNERIIIAGSGGQGIMLLGKVLAEAAMRENKFVTWFPSYGAEVRGGTAYCIVVISDKEIGNPCVEKADTLIIMNRPSLDKFKSRLNKGGLLVLNSSLAGGLASKNINIIQHPFTDMAIKIGNIRTANMVALGAYVSEKKIVKKDTLFEVFSYIAPKGKKDLVQINRIALEEGMRL